MNGTVLALCRYIGIQEKDFEWLTEQLVSLANKYCQGRIVSALEGGYRIQGGVVSAFARSVAAHVRALSSRSLAEWSWADVKAEQQREKQRKVMSLLTSAMVTVCRHCIAKADDKGDSKAVAKEDAEADAQDYLPASLSIRKD